MILIIALYIHTFFLKKIKTNKQWNKLNIKNINGIFYKYK